MNFEPTPPGEDIVIDVTYKRAGSGYIKGRPFPLAGEGQVRISGSQVTFTAKAGRAPASDEEQTLSFDITQIANVGHKARQVLFCIYPPGSDREGTPQFIGGVWTKSSADAQKLFHALPRHLSQAVRQMSEDRNHFARSLFQVTPKAFVTPLILTANVAVFAAMVVTGAGIMEPKISDLIRWGANFGPLTFAGEWWRIVTNTFVHIGLIHIGLNMWVFNNIGRLVERIYGNIPFLLIYLGAGITGSLASLCTHPETVSAGASGAIFGLYGALIGYSLRQKHAIPRTVLKELQSSSLGFVAYNVIFGFSIAGIDNAAHLGGLLGGAVLGYAAALPLDEGERRRRGIARLAQSVLAFAVLAGLLFAALPQKGYQQYFRFTESYIEEEELAYNAQMEISRQLADGELTPVEAADRLEQECLPRWERMRDDGTAIKLPKGGLYDGALKEIIEFAGLRADALSEIINGLRNHDTQRIDNGIKIQLRAERLAESIGVRMQGE